MSESDQTSNFGILLLGLDRQYYEENVKKILGPRNPHTANKTITVISYVASVVVSDSVLVSMPD